LRQNAYEPALAESLSYALLSDPDAGVRQEAALALAAYLDTGSARIALEHAVSNDGSAEVRIAARMAMLDLDQQAALTREMLLDRSLSPAERIAPSRVGTRSFGSPEQEEALAYAEIVAGSDDPTVKRHGLLHLQMVAMTGSFPGSRFESGQDGLAPEIVAVAIDSMAVDDDQVRRLAMIILMQQAANPDVRAALETLVNEDPAFALQHNVAAALERAQRQSL
jgi:hypothetical protein